MIKLQLFTRDDFARMIDWAVSPEFLVQWAGTEFTYPGRAFARSAKSGRRVLESGCDEHVGR
ncbi:hypothetical protein [Lihuaxuella thermophila]|uniref:Uncharacterized protein n=1 Tax=Lihuaxuella thermophila TaxID=1173111 RepID=A0A1H8HHB5_9BACL|nr:hypothetical protein SAMN05444955_11431 [Lihuaxuella thermophila]